MFNNINDNPEEYWISISDVMSGLMVIFLFISITYLKDVLSENKRMAELANNYKDKKQMIYEELNKEFNLDLKKWNAIIRREDLSLRFMEPTVLFNIKQSELKNEFESILDDFFPRYINILRKHKEDIVEVRIEGHTSSGWSTANNSLEAYFKNMSLSQDRARAVLYYCLNLSISKEDLGWSKKYITANGLSSSRVITKNTGGEDKVRSRRVEFKVKTNAEDKLKMIEKKGK